MKWLRRCVAAFRFLTILPLPGSFGDTDEDLAGSPLFFPVVGLVLGLIAGACAWVLWRLLPPPVAAVLLTIIFFSFSGALHLDGLADSADGLFSARGRERILVIMRDSRIGAMGVIALVMVLALKISSLSVLSRDEAVRAALLIPISGRCAIVVMMALLPYVRPEGGLGTLFYSRNVKPAALGGLLLLFFAGFLVMGLPGLIIAGAAMAAVAFFALFCRLKIGGATGDTLGASCELAEVFIVLALAALA